MAQAGMPDSDLEEAQCWVPHPCGVLCLKGGKATCLVNGRSLSDIIRWYSIQGGTLDLTAQFPCNGHPERTGSCIVFTHHCRREQLRQIRRSAIRASRN